MSIRRTIFQLILGKRLPVTSGDLRVPGLNKPVVIRRDKYGIACIDASTDTDAHFGVGFCQGQDRAFQLEFTLRIVRGTLAELVGAKGLEVDRFSRRIGFHRAAKQQVSAIEPDVMLAFQAFCHGVNAGHSVGLPRKPHELALLGGTLTPWEPADVLGVVKLISFRLPSNWDVELARLRMLRADGVETVRKLDPCYIGSPDVINALEDDLNRFQQHVPSGGGSNNWLIAGSRTASGKPLLANDPHLDPTVPPPWYVVQVRTPEWAVTGATLAGAPPVIIGHNGFASWGVTAGLTDNTDLYIESRDGPGEIVRETIHVKDGEDHVEEVKITPRGPVVSPLMEGEKEVISMEAVWLKPLSIRGFFDAPKARSFEQFRKGFDRWPCLPLNIVYADSSRETGYQLVGQVPVRKVGHGTIVARGDDPNVGWESELLPFDKMPHLANPPEGFFATANSNPWNHIPPEKPRAYVGADYVDDYRTWLIRDELSKRSSMWDIGDILKLQMNQRSRPWEEIREKVVALTSDNTDARTALELLREWNGHVTEESPAATVFEMFLVSMVRRVAEAVAPKSWRTAIGCDGSGLFQHNLFGDRRITHIVKLISEQPAGYLTRPWPEVMAETLAEIVAMLREKYGPGPQWWQWGSFRTLRVQHPMLKDHKLLGPIFNLPTVAWGGDSNTINQAGTSITTPTATPHNIPNLRIAIDTANWSNSRVVLCGGQSGNPCSPHYQDQFYLWQAGEAVQLPWDQTQIIRSTVSVLRLASEG